MRTATSTEPPPPPSAPAWAGWFRPHRGARFEQIVEAADYSECWERVLNVLAERGQTGGDSLVAERGTDPNKGASARRPASADR